MKKLIIFVLTLFLTFAIFLSSKSVNAELTPVTPFYGGDILNGQDLYLFTSYSTTPNFENGYISKKTISEQDVYYQENSYFNGWYKNLGKDLIDTYTEPEHEPENPYFYFYITFNNMLGYYMQLALNSLEPFEADYVIKYSDNSYTQLTVSDGENFLFATPENETSKEVVWLCWSVYYPDYIASFKPLTSREAYDFGFISGENQGYNNGYNEGYSTGYSTGYNNGYSNGTADIQFGYNTVVNFNQLLQNGNFANNSIWQGVNGATISIGDNTLTFTSSNIDSFVRTNYNIVGIQGHKYLFVFDGKSTTITQKINVGAFGGYLSSPLIDINTNWRRYFYIGTLPQRFDATAFIYNKSSSLETVYIRNYQIFDLTQIYGSGNEPTNYSTFKEDFPSEYYEYTLTTMYSIDYENGYIEGKKLGYNLGYDDGKDTQATQQLTSTGWINSIFGGISSLLNIQIFPGVTIGLIVGIPFIISLAYFVIRAFRGGGGA